jgi:hypothetical protein
MIHVRGDHLNDLSFPMQIRNNPVNTGCISAHHSCISPIRMGELLFKNEDDIISAV